MVKYFYMEGCAVETKDLILRKAVFEDWPAIWRNVWSRAETVRNHLPGGKCRFRRDDPRLRLPFSGAGDLEQSPSRQMLPAEMF